jgi:hypothetical protein
MPDDHSARDGPGERPDARRSHFSWMQSLPAVIRLPRGWAIPRRGTIARAWLELLHRLDEMPPRIWADELRRLVDPDGGLARGLDARSWESEFGRALPRLCPGACRRRLRRGGRLAYAYDMPPLAECRYQLLEHLGGERLDSEG